MDNHFIPNKKCNLYIENVFFSKEILGDACYGMLSPFLCGGKGVYFRWLMDSISE